jgi:hypothetical protein
VRKGKSCAVLAELMRGLLSLTPPQRTPLMCAARWGQLQAVQVGGRNWGVGWNVVIASHMSLLPHLLSSPRSQLLLYLGAPVEETDVANRTCLQWAIQYGRMEVARFLLRHGANLEHVDAAGMTVRREGGREGRRACGGESGGGQRRGRRSVVREGVSPLPSISSISHCTTPSATSSPRPSRCCWRSVSLCPSPSPSRPPFPPPSPRPSSVVYSVPDTGSARSPLDTFLIDASPPPPPLSLDLAFRGVPLS